MTGAPRGTTALEVEANGPFDTDAAWASLVVHAVAGLHAIDTAAREMSRWVEIGGDPYPITIRLRTGGVTVITPTTDTCIHDELAGRVRHWFDLAADLTPINTHLATDPLFAEQVAARPGVRIARFQDPFEAVVLTVIGQQVSLAAARLFGSRVLSAYGREVPGAVTDDAPSGAAKLFPTAAGLAAEPLDELRETIGLTGSRARTVHEAAELFRDLPAGELPSRATLNAVHGIGPWTLDYLAIRAGTDPDAFPSSDAVLRRALATSSTDGTPIDPARWSPYRSHAATRLWLGTLEA